MSHPKSLFSFHARSQFIGSSEVRYQEAALVTDHDNDDGVGVDVGVRGRFGRSDWCRAHYMCYEWCMCMCGAGSATATGVEHFIRAMSGMRVRSQLWPQ